MNTKKYGVLLINLGTPNNLKVISIKRFLDLFLSDNRVINKKFFFKYFLYLFITPFYALKLIKLYRIIWTKYGSPFLIYCIEQQNALSRMLQDFYIEFGMHYSFPSIAFGLDKLLIKNIKKIIILPLYPQYSSTTTAASFDIFSRTLKKYKRIPEINFISGYANNIFYINALKETIENSFLCNGKPDLLIISYHNIPKSYVKDGDIYPDECKITTDLIAKAINFPINKIIMSYQSNLFFGSWLKPYTSFVLKKAAFYGVKHVQLICPGFSVDCLETLYEVNIKYRKIFFNSGGEKYYYIPALNVLNSHILMMSNIIKKSISLQ